MFKTSVLFLVSSFGLCASTFTFDVSVNTSSLLGTSGALYLQFNPGDVSSDAATAQLSNFSGPVLAGSPSTSGGASGVLPGPASITNSLANNDYFQSLAFGSILKFRVLFTESYTGNATTGSVFNFGLYQADGVTPVLTSQPDGYSIIVNLDNTNHAFAQSTTTSATISSVVPEPSTVLLFAAGTIALGVMRRFRF